MKGTRSLKKLERDWVGIGLVFSFISQVNQENNNNDAATKSLAQDYSTR